MTGLSGNNWMAFISFERIWRHQNWHICKALTCSKIPSDFEPDESSSFWNILFSSSCIVHTAVTSRERKWHHVCRSPESYNVSTKFEPKSLSSFFFFFFFFFFFNAVVYMFLRKWPCNLYLRSRSLFELSGSDTAFVWTSS